MPSRSLDQFPLAIAGSSSFCNRTDEIEHLTHNIHLKRPTLLVSPRRYGKTSLVLHVLKKMKWPYAHIDLFSAVDEHDIERLILNGIGELILKIEDTPKKALSLAKKIFEGTQVQITLPGFKLTINTQNTEEKPAYRILELLKRLEQLSKHTKQDLILFFDEFQCIREVPQSHAIESVLRQIAQLTQSIAFIFSGSSRHLLDQLFNDRNRPFYKLCDRITLERISEKCYEKHIQKAAIKQFGEKICDDSLREIFSLSERHPYYLNLLCSRLWKLKKVTPILARQTWEQYAAEERSSVCGEIQLLSRNQRKLLIMLARVGGVEKPLSQAFLAHAKMSKTSVTQALLFLKQQDYIERGIDQRIHVLDPLNAFILGDLLFG